jgi:nitrite reductase (NADH) large subunit
LADVEAMRVYIATYRVKTAVIIGAGFTGMEAADALAQHQIHVILVDQAQQVLPSAIDQNASVFIESLMQKHGACFYPQTSVIYIEDKDKQIVSVTLSDGRTIATNMVIYAIGSQPNTEFAQQAGIQLRNGYIAVNKQMQTNISNIYAAGDCAVLPGMSYPSFTWPIAMYQGTIAAYSMIGQTKEYITAPAIISSAFFGIKFASCGVIQPPDDIDNTSQYTITVQAGQGFYHYLVHEGTTLRGFVLIGNTQRLAELRRTIVIE